MSYVALYRKYRPKNFSEVVGQDVVVKVLKNSIQSGKIGHAYIFSGTKGTGKTSVAKIFAKAINCLEPVDGDVCGKCSVCSYLNENPVDIIEIDAASNNGVEEIREIRNNVKVMPTCCKYKVYIIDEVHMLSMSAFNALLKTLEEPPEHVVFILATTELNKIPSTVLSRCQKLDFKKISNKFIVQQLKHILEMESRQLSDDVIDLIASLSDGAFRDAINLMDQLLTLDKDDVDVEDVYKLVGIISDDIAFQFLDFIFTFDIKNGLLLIDNLFKSGVNFYKVTEKIQFILTDIIIYNSTKDYFKSSYEEKLSNYCFKDINNLFLLNETLFDLSASLKKSVTQKSLFETYFIKMCLYFKHDNNNFSDIDSTSSISNEDTISANSSSTLQTNVSNEISSNKNIRIHNSLALASKKEKNDFLVNYNIIENYFSHKDYSSISKLLSKAIPEVVSNKNILFVFKNSFEVVLFDKNVNIIETFLHDLFGIKYKVVAVSSDEWKNIKQNYINDINNGIIYKYEEETVVTNKNKSSLEKEAENIFGETIVSG